MQLALHKAELRYAEALTCADNIVTARLVIRHIATLRNCVYRYAKNYFRIVLAQPCF